MRHALLAFLSFAAFSTFARLSDAQQASVWRRVDAPSTARIRAAGRVLDALDGTPVVAATVEFWTEDDGEPRRKTHVATTKVDGSFVVHASDPDEVGSKLVVHATGHVSSGASRERYQEFFLLPQGEPLGLRFMDVEGDPVPGVQVRSRHSCAHDAPALVGYSGADGRVSFPNARLPYADDLYVEAPGYGSRRLSGSRLLDDSARSLGADVVLLRIPAVGLRLLDADGTPVANRRVLQGGEPKLVRTATDADGRLRLDQRFASDQEVFLRVGADKSFWGGGRASGSDWTLRVNNGQLPAEMDVASTLVVAVEDPEAPLDAAERRLRLEIEVTHEDGWMAFGEGEHGLPAGAVTVTAGGAQTGLCAWREDLTLEAGERHEVRAVLRPAPLARLLLPAADEGSSWTLHVQAEGGGFELSVTDEVPAVYLPAGVPLTLVSEGPNGALHRARVKALEPGEVIEVDLRAERTLLRKDWQADRELLLTAASSEAPQVALDANWRVRAPVVVAGENGAPAFEGLAENESVVRVPREACFSAVAKARGHLPRWICGGPGAALEEHRVELQRLASLELVGLVRTALAAEAEGKPQGPGRMRFDELAPGPLLLRAEDAQGRWHTTLVDLAPGETRVVSFGGR